MTVLEALGITAEHIKAWVEEQFEEQLADVEFKKISVKSIGNQINDDGSFIETRFIELGSTVVNTVIIEWELNGTPVSQTINGDVIDITDRNKRFDFEDGLTRGERSFTLSVSDGRGATSSKTTSVNFVNGRYYGALEYECDINSDVIKSLNKKFAKDSANISFTVSPEGKRPVYALPSRLGHTPSFKFNNQVYSWEKLGPFDVDNGFGVTESYDVWRHCQNVPDTIAVEVI